MDSSKNTSVATQEMAEYASQLDTLANVNGGEEGAPPQQPAEPSISTVKRRLHLEEMGAARSTDTQPWSPFAKKPKSSLITATDIMNISFHPLHTSTQAAATAARALLDLSSTDSYTDEIARSFGMNTLTDDSPPPPPVNTPEIGHVTPPNDFSATLDDSDILTPSQVPPTPTDDSSAAVGEEQGVVDQHESMDTNVWGESTNS